MPERLAPALQDALAEVSLAAARADGADGGCRGVAPGGPGYCHPVTRGRRATDDMALVAEEQFGPVLPVLTYAGIDEAVARATTATWARARRCGRAARTAPRRSRRAWRRAPSG